MLGVRALGYEHASQLCSTRRGPSPMMHQSACTQGSSNGPGSIQQQSGPSGQCIPASGGRRRSRRSGRLRGSRGGIAHCGWRGRLPHDSSWGCGRSTSCGVDEYFCFVLAGCRVAKGVPVVGRWIGMYTASKVAGSCMSDNTEGYEKRTGHGM